MKIKINCFLCFAALLFLVLSLGGCTQPPRMGNGGERPENAAMFDSSPRGQTSAELVAVLQEETNEEIIGIWTDDYNADGELEAYAMTAKEAPGKSIQNAEGLSLWFIKRNEARVIAEGNLDTVPTFFEFPDKKLCCISSYTQEGIDSQVFFVAGKYAHSYGSFGARLIRDERNGNLFYIMKKETDAVYNSATGTYSGETNKPYYLFFDGNFFREYAGASMREDQLRAVKGADTILTAISEGGYNVEEIFRRDNGVININISKTVSDNGNSVTSYHNVTLLMRGDSVSLSPKSESIGQSDENSRTVAGEIIAERFQNPERFSYGGKYSAFAVSEIAVFPEAENIA